MGRIIKAHNLLQALSRVDRTYREFRYGYVVDFAGIESQFKKTSQDYFNEPQSELGDELQYYSDLFLTEEVIENREKEILNNVYNYSKGRKYNQAVLFIGSGHRNAMIKKIEKRRTQDELEIQWIYYNG